MGLPGWGEVDEDFARGVLWALGGALDNLNHDST
jgi:hypothetical protein